VTASQGRQCSIH